MNQKMRYELTRIATGWLLIACGFLLNDIYFLLGALVCLLFSCEYDPEEEEDVFPDMTHHYQDRMFNKQLFGVCYILLAIILHRYNDIIPSHLLMIVGVYYSTYHPNLYFYPKDSELVSEHVYTEDEINKMDK
jgi:hypothetical protein